MATEKEVLRIGGREVTVTNPRKVYFPETGHTKLDLVNYYLAVADGAVRGVEEGWFQSAIADSAYELERKLNRGDHIVVVLNGETTLDIRDSKFADGNIRLQYQQFPIAFRNIKIRPLP